VLVVEHNAIELSPRISEADVADYIALLKPRVMSLVIFTALVGLVIAPVHVHPVLAFTSILCIAVGAGASGALNMWYESDIDALMSRTANRPIPRGRVTRAEALHDGAEALDRAEHRDRRRRRRLASGGGVGGGDWFGVG
jgi:protoheme IX farnesyltransferase